MTSGYDQDITRLSNKKKEDEEAEAEARGVT